MLFGITYQLFKYNLLKIIEDNLINHQEKFIKKNSPD